MSHPYGCLRLLCLSITVTFTFYYYWTSLKKKLEYWIFSNVDRFDVRHKSDTLITNLQSLLLSNALCSVAIHDLWFTKSLRERSVQGGVFCGYERNPLQNDGDNPHVSPRLINMFTPNFYFRAEYQCLLRQMWPPEDVLWFIHVEAFLWQLPLQQL